MSPLPGTATVMAKSYLWGNTIVRVRFGSVLPCLRVGCDTQSS